MRDHLSSSDQLLRIQTRLSAPPLTTNHLSLNLGRKGASSSYSKNRRPTVNSRRSQALWARENLSSTLLSISPKHFELSLPLPPSINHQYATVHGRRVLSSSGRQYKASIAQLILAVLYHSPNRDVLFRNLRSHLLILTVRFFFKSALRRDLDGGLKIAQDAISEALTINDNRMAEIHLYRDKDPAHPRMEVSLSAKLIVPGNRFKEKKGRAGAILLTNLRKRKNSVAR